LAKVGEIEWARESYEAALDSFELPLYLSPYFKLIPLLCQQNEPVVLGRLLGDLECKIILARQNNRLSQFEDGAYLRGLMAEYLSVSGIWPDLQGSFERLFDLFWEINPEVYLRVDTEFKKTHQEPEESLD